MWINSCSTFLYSIWKMYFIDTLYSFRYFICTLRSVFSSLVSPRVGGGVSFGSCEQVIFNKISAKGHFTKSYNRLCKVLVLKDTVYHQLFIHFLSHCTSCLLPLASISWLPSIKFSSITDYLTTMLDCCEWSRVQCTAQLTLCF